jgi:hypothetical protein
MRRLRQIKWDWRTCFTIVYIRSTYEWLMNWRGFERKRSWPDLRYSQLLLRSFSDFNTISTYVLIQFEVLFAIDKALFKYGVESHDFTYGQATSLQDGEMQSCEQDGVSLIVDLILRYWKYLKSSIDFRDELSLTRLSFNLCLMHYIGRRYSVPIYLFIYLWFP